MTSMTDQNPFIEAPCEHRSRGGGDQWRFEFSNGYGASVIQNSFSYGGSSGMYELAVMHDGHLTYTTPIMTDVLGWQTVDDVRNVLRAIAELPAVA